MRDFPLDLCDIGLTREGGIIHWIRVMAKRLRDCPLDLCDMDLDLDPDLTSDLQPLLSHTGPL